MIYKAVLVSNVVKQISYISTFLDSFLYGKRSLHSHIGHYRVLTGVSELYNRFLIVTDFIYSSVYMSVPISRFLSPSSFPPVIISLLSTSVALFLFCP